MPGQAKYIYQNFWAICSWSCQEQLEGGVPWKETCSKPPLAPSSFVPSWSELHLPHIVLTSALIWREKNSELITFVESLGFLHFVKAKFASFLGLDTFVVLPLLYIARYNAKPQKLCMYKGWVCDFDSLLRRREEISVSMSFRVI